MNPIICNRFEYCFLHEVQYVTPDTIKLKTGFRLRELSSWKIEYTRSDKNSDAGTIITETVKLKVNHKTVLTELCDARLILVLHTSEGKCIIVGTSDYPITYSYQQKLPETEFTFTVKH